MIGTRFLRNSSLVPAATRAVVMRQAGMGLGNHVVNAATAHQQQQSMGFATKHERPVSPHVFIYDWPIAAISSITTRITGAALVIGVYGIGIGALLGGDMPLAMANLGSSGIGAFVKFDIAFPVLYHYAAAARHFYWEYNPDSLNPEIQKQSSIALFGATGALSAILALI